MTRIGRLTTYVWRVATLGAVVALHAMAARAANTANAAQESSSVSKPAVVGNSGIARGATPRAHVFFVGVHEDCTALAQTIGDLLVAHNILTHFEYRQSLTARDLSSEDKASLADHTAVWVLLPKPEAVQLVFADPNLQRFLLRELPLRRGLDDFGRETIAQVVESSLLVLLQGKTGMSRADVQVALGPYLASNSTRPNTVPPAQVQSRPLRPSRSTPTLPAVRHRLGASYGFQLSGTAFGLQQGPGVVSGLEWDRLSDSLFVQAAAEWHFERNYRTFEFDLAVQSSLAWLLFGWRKPMREAHFIATAGPGIGVDRISSKLLAGSTAKADSPQVSLSPWARAAVGFELGDSPLVVQFLGTIDATVYQTHYDINRNGHTEPMATPWVVRPGLNVTALWR